MTIVQHQLIDALGNPLVNVRVPIRLATNGYTSGGHAEIVRTVTVTTDATGTYQADLTPQSQIDPAGTHYEVTHPSQTPGASITEVLSFVVSDDAGPLWLRDLLVDNPAQPSPLVAGVAEIVAGANVTVDNTDPTHPVIAATGGGGGGGGATVTDNGDGTGTLAW